jgi:hypothetical protein
MSDYQSVGDVLSQLIDEGYISEYPEQPPFDETETPIYMKALLGFGGWIAALFFFIFAGWCLVATILQGIESEAVAGVVLGTVGLVFMIATVIAQRQYKSAFASQLALAYQIAGQALFVVGANMAMYGWGLSFTAEVIASALIVIVMEIIMIPLYEDGIFRFLATIAAVTAVNTLVYELNIPGSLSILIALLAFAVVVIWSDMLPATTQIQYRSMLQAVGYGLVFGLFGTITFELSQNPKYMDAAHVGLHKPLITALMLLAITIWYEIRLLGDYEIPLSHRATAVILALTVIITLPTLTTPGILAALLLIILGYRRRHNVLLVFGYLFMAGFISYFYYSLQTTLLVKSFILMATGLLFLLGGYVFRRMLPVPEVKEA